MEKSKTPRQSKRGTGQVIVLGLVLLAIAAGFYFKDTIFDFYNNLGKNLQKFIPISSQILDEVGKKTDLGNVINEFKKEVLAPAPLNIGGKENQVVLTKAKIMAHTNIQRYNNGLLLPLIENEKLYLAAKAKADDMFKNQYFDHVSPSGVNPGELVKSFDYDYIITGENLILGNFSSEAEVVQAWMNSPGHRANILNNRFVDIGVAVVKGTYQGQVTWIGVQEFSLPLSTCAQPEVGLKNQIDSNKNYLDQLSLQIDAKREEINDTNPRSPQYNVLVDEHNKLVAEYNSLTQETKNLISQYNNDINIFNQCVAGK